MTSSNPNTKPASTPGTHVRASERHRSFIDALDASAAELEVYSPAMRIENEVRVADMRRSRRRRFVDPLGMFSLVEVDGVLVWRAGEGAASVVQGGRRRARLEVAAGETVAQYRFPKLEPNKVSEFLSGLDLKLTPQQGLRRFHDGKLSKVERPTAKHRVLVFVHGTFSNSDHFFDELEATAPGRALLNAATKHYDEILAFDHPTLSVSPMINGCDLGRLFAGSPAAIDVIAHSRGGLVTRWWLEGFSAQNGVARRAVLVGSPLGGTSLASPPRLRSAMSLITNVGKALTAAGSAASTALPFLSVPVGLLKVVTSITSIGAKAPLFDAAIAMVPGLHGQSRVSNAAELIRLRRPRSQDGPRYFAVRSNFETDAPGWRFWRHFRSQSLADSAADVVFDGHNDLVVDTASMTEFYDDAFPIEDCWDFATSATVHHVNYFRQPETLAFIAQRLAIPGAGG